MSRYLSRQAMKHLVARVAPAAAEARFERLRLAEKREQDRVANDATAEAKRMAEPHPLDAAIAKFAADKKAAAEKDAFVLKDQTDVFVSGTTLRERKEEATRAIRRENKNKSSTEIVADLQRKERQANE